MQGRLNWLDWTPMTVVVIGALNWGLVGFFNFDLVRAIFGDGSLGTSGISAISRVIFAVVGVAGLYSIYSLTKAASAQSRLMPVEERERMRKVA
ncbi:MAG TPA: DUF378 domain-containing protein [Actinobacteria bacterium]|nr:DUF378 domain-containing protein [Actinomycetota bacterium]